MKSVASEDPLTEPCSGQLRTVIQPPVPAAIINSLRAIGYSFETAVADVIDNSITAKATRVRVLFRTSPQWFAIADDGCGMSASQLLDAMRLGALDFHHSRETADLGRFGLGLKTASLSQCRRVTVITKQGNVTSAARWDLDEIANTNEWALELPDVEHLVAQDYCAPLRDLSAGTVVVWEKLDRALAGEANVAEALETRVLSASDHLRLVFHRYLDGEVRNFVISLNGRTLEPLDPFLRQRSSIAGEEKRTAYHSPIFVRAYILPHISKLSTDDIRKLGGASSLRDSQGFYIYRNYRLIVWGTWFRLVARHELSRLARVQVDITNELDEQWNLDVKKSAAHPPEQVRAILRNIVAVVAERSATVFRERRPNARLDSQRVPVWERVVLREAVRYEINRKHPLIVAAVTHEENDGKGLIASLLRIIELGLPLRSIYVDQANDTSVRQADDDTVVSELEEALRNMLETANSASSKLQMISSLESIEPFSLFPALMTSIKESISNHA